MHTPRHLRSINSGRTKSLFTVGAFAAVAILAGPIQAQVVPAPVTTRSWDAANGAVATFNWGDAVNWATDTLPDINDIAAFPAPNAVITIDLGATTREVGSFFLGNAGGSANFLFQNGTLVTNSINQNQDDGNALTPTALVSSKNGGLDVINASVSSNTLQLQGQVTAGGLNKFGGATLRFGTSGTAFNNAINGDIVIYGGTLQAAAASTVGVNNPLGGSGDIVIGAANVTLSLTAGAALATGVDYDFVRDIRAGNNSFTLNANLAGGTDAFDPNMRAGTLFMGNAILTTSQGAGFRVALDAINMAAGSTNTRVQANALTFVDGLIGDASSNLYKRGGSELQIRGNSEATFAGDIFHGEGTLTLLSTGAGLNPAGGSDSTIFFGNGYGVTALDGGQLVNLRSDASLDFGSNIAFRPGVTIGRIDVNRVGAAATNQTLSLGDVNVSGKLLRVLGGNGFQLGLDNVTVDAGATGNFETASANTLVGGNLVLGAGSTFNKLGGNTLTLNADNSATSSGTINVRAGVITGAVAGSLGTGPITVGMAAADSNGFFSAASRLNYNAVGASANASGTDVTVLIGGAADLGVTPAATDTFAVQAGGRIQGTAAQLAGLTVGTNLTLATDAIVVHDAPGAATGSVTNLANNASTYYGLAATANTLPNIGAGTPWKGVTGDNTARIIQGIDAITPAIFNIEGGDNDPNTIEAYAGSMFGVNLSLGTTTPGDGAFQWNSVNAAKVTLGIRGVGGSHSAGFVPGGLVLFNEVDAVSTLSTHVDKIVVEQGVLSLSVVGAQGAIPIEVRNGGSLDIGSVVGNVIDGSVTLKSGGVFYFNDNQILGGTGTITFETGSILDISGSAPNTFFSTATNPLVFAGANNMTVRFAASEITGLDANISNVAPTYVVSGGAATAILPGTNVNVTTNTQTAGVTIEGGILTNDGTSRGFTAPITLNNTNFTVAASRGTTLAVTGDVATTGSVQIGSATAIDFRDKTPNPDRVNGLGIADPHNGSPQVVFTGSFNVGGSLTATRSHLAFANANTNIAGDLNFQGNVLYLDDGGPVSGGSSLPGDLTTRLTDVSGLAINRVADRIILGNFGRIEMGVTSGLTGTTTNHTITQPFVIEGAVNPVDKRSIFVNRSTGAATTNVFFNDVLVKSNAQVGFDENNTIIRTNLRLEGNATLVRNHDDYDFRNLTKAPGAPANITVFAGEPNFGWDDATEYLVNGSNAVLASSVDGTIASGITVDIVRAQLFFDRGSTLDGTVRTQTAPNRGDSFVVFRDTVGTTATPYTHVGAGEVQLGRSVAANGPEDLEIRGAEVTAGAPATLTVNVPIRVVNDGDNNSVDAIIRSNRQNDSTITASTVLSTLNVDTGAKVSVNSQILVPMTVSNVNLNGAGASLESTNNDRIFIGNVNGGVNAVNLTGPAQARITGNLSAGTLNVTGAGLDFDPGVGNTSTVTGALNLSGKVSVRTGTADFGATVLTGAAVQTVPGLREMKTLGALDETTPNTSNEIALGTTYAQLPAGNWGENQTVTYTGQINIPDNGTLGDGLGSVAFAKGFDDSIRIVIDGTTILRNTAFNDAVASGAIELTTGLHNIEIRLGQGTGGTGAVGQDGNVFNLGLGIDITSPVSTQTGSGTGLVIDGSQYVAPVDNGSGSLFQTTTVKSRAEVSGGAVLNAGGFSNLAEVRLTGTGTATFNANGTGGAVASTADAIVVSGTVGGVLNVARSIDSATVTNLDVAGTGTFTKDGNGLLTVTGAGTGSGAVNVAGGTLAASTATANFGSGNVSVFTTAISLSIQTGVANAIADTATLSLAGGGTGGTADFGFAFLAAGVNETVGNLLLGGVPQLAGFTYGATGSGADVIDNEYFSGTGVIAVIPEPGSFATLLSGLGCLLGLQRFRRRR